MNKIKKMLISSCGLASVVVPAIMVVSCSNNYSYESELSTEITIKEGTDDILVAPDVDAFVKDNMFDRSTLKEGRGCVIIHQIYVKSGVVYALKDPLTGKGKAFKEGNEIEMKIIITGTANAPEYSYYINNTEVKEANFKIYTDAEEAVIQIKEIARW